MSFQRCECVFQQHQGGWNCSLPSDCVSWVPRVTVWLMNKLDLQMAPLEWNSFVCRLTVLWSSRTRTCTHKPQSVPVTECKFVCSWSTVRSNKLKRRSLRKVYCRPGNITVAPAQNPELPWNASAEHFKGRCGRSISRNVSSDAQISG